MDDNLNANANVSKEVLEKPPNCYECIHRAPLPGDVHSCCNHPEANEKKDPMLKLIALLAGAGRMGVIQLENARKLGVTGHRIGVEGGYFQWPWNYDPRWLMSCNGFEEKTFEEKT